jgi:hypothetical protein
LFAINVRVIPNAAAFAERNARTDEYAVMLTGVSPREGAGETELKHPAELPSASLVG